MWGMNGSLSWFLYPKIKKAKGQSWRRFTNNFLGNLKKLLCIYALCVLYVIDGIESYLPLITLTHKAV